LNVATKRIHKSKEIMTQLPGLTVAIQVEDYVLLIISALLTTALFADGGYGKLQTAWRDLLGQGTGVLILVTNVKIADRCAPFDIAFG
jgi:hypothetical protein